MCRFKFVVHVLMFIALFFSLVLDLDSAHLCCFSLRSLLLSIVCRPSFTHRPSPKNRHAVVPRPRTRHAARVHRRRARADDRSARQTDGGADERRSGSGSIIPMALAVADPVHSCSTVVISVLLSSRLQLPPSAPSPCRLCDAPLCTTTAQRQTQTAARCRSLAFRRRRQPIAGRHARMPPPALAAASASSALAAAHADR